MLTARHAAGLSGLLLLVACGGSPSPERTAVDANAAALESELGNLADRYDAEASNAADTDAAAAMRNAADGLNDVPDNVAGAAEARTDNMQ